jgi:hypothetical protein
MGAVTGEHGSHGRVLRQGGALKDAANPLGTGAGRARGTKPGTRGAAAQRAERTSAPLPSQ